MLCPPDYRRVGPSSLFFAHSPKVCISDSMWLHQCSGIGTYTCRKAPSTVKGTLYVICSHTDSIFFSKCLTRVDKANCPQHDFIVEESRANLSPTETIWCIHEKMTKMTQDRWKARILYQSRKGNLPLLKVQHLVSSLPRLLWHLWRAVKRRRDVKVVKMALSKF